MCRVKAGCNAFGSQQAHIVALYSFYVGGITLREIERESEFSIEVMHSIVPIRCCIALRTAKVIARHRTGMDAAVGRARKPGDRSWSSGVVKHKVSS